MKAENIWNHNSNSKFSIDIHCFASIINIRDGGHPTPFRTKESRRNSLINFRLIEYKIRPYSAILYHGQTAWTSKNSYCIVIWKDIWPWTVSKCWYGKNILRKLSKSWVQFGGKDAGLSPERTSVLESKNFLLMNK